jgi:hypothetical protein
MLMFTQGFPVRRSTSHDKDVSFETVPIVGTVLNFTHRKLAGVD